MKEGWIDLRPLHREAGPTFSVANSRAGPGTDIHGLAHEPRPHGVKKLSGRDVWRIRIGDYRVLYEIQDARLLILVVDIGHRPEISR
jgi:mRNA interferase RelE/StbE